ncbi:MAG: hypothetical protein AB7R40_25270 [Nitrospiraceae bacterium]
MTQVSPHYAAEVNQAIEALTAAHGRRPSRNQIYEVIGGNRQILLKHLADHPLYGKANASEPDREPAPEPGSESEPGLKALEPSLEPPTTAAVVRPHEALQAALVEAQKAEFALGDAYMQVKNALREKQEALRASQRFQGRTPKALALAAEIAQLEQQQAAQLAGRVQAAQAVMQAQQAFQAFKAQANAALVRAQKCILDAGDLESWQRAEHDARIDAAIEALAAVLKDRMYAEALAYRRERASWLARAAAAQVA